MHLVGPKASNPNPSIDFNTRVSVDAYSRALDNVLMTKGAKFLSEDASARTMKVEATLGSAKSEIENIPGVEKVTSEQKSSGGWRQHRL